jgi:DNA-binding SARP family transcriptional activator
MSCTAGGISRAATRVGTTLLLAASTAGLPALLVVTTGPPVHGRLPAWHQIVATLGRPDNGSMFLGALRLITWIAWLAFTIAVLAEIQAAIRGRSAPHIPGLSPAQFLARALIAGLISTAGASPAFAASAAIIPVAAMTSTTHAPPAAATLTDYTTGPAAPAASTSVAYMPSAAAAASSNPEASLPLAGMFAAGLLAGGIVATIGQMRHRQRQERQPGRRIALPGSEDAQRTERQLRAAARTSSTGQAAIRTTLNALAAGLRTASQPVPRAAGIHITGNGADILLAAPAARPPAMFRAVPGSGDMCWRLPAETLIRLRPAPGAGSGDLMPGLVSAGTTGGGGHLLIDLETSGVTTITGPIDLADRMLATAALELATNTWAGSYDLLLSGFAPVAAARYRAQDCGALSQAITVIERRAAELALTARAGEDARPNRLSDPSCPDWTLTLLIARAQPTPDQMSRILAVARPGSGIAVLLPAGPLVATGAPDMTARIELDEDLAGNITASIGPFGLTARPRLLDSRDYQAITEILAAAQQPDVPAGTPPYLAASSTAAAGPQPRDTARQLRVGVLGPVTITGAAEELQPKQAELVLALALSRPSGLSMSALCTRLGADEDQPKPPDSLRQIMTRTRRRLGPAPDGDSYLRHIGNAQYVLAADAAVDLDDFRRLSAGGQKAGDSVMLTEALSLVRGQPLDNAFHWWIDPAIIEDIRAEVADTASALAELELRASRPAAAARAARAGLSADPAAEQLWRLLMRAEDAAGNKAGVHEAWRRCMQIISEIAADGEPHPATTALYHQLTRREQQRTPAGVR